MNNQETYKESSTQHYKSHELRLNMEEDYRIRDRIRDGHDRLIMREQKERKREPHAPCVASSVSKISERDKWDMKGYFRRDILDLKYDFNIFE